MMRNLLYLLAIAVLSTVMVAQNASVNIKGFVTDIATGKPVGKEMDMEVVGKNTGKKFVVKINSKSGEYLQPLPSGDVYTLTFKSYAVFKKVETLDLPASQKFHEERHDFTVRAIVQGYELANVSAFDAGQSTVLAGVQSQFAEVQEALRGNRDLRVFVTVAQENFPPPPPPAPKKETKPAKKPAKGKKGAPVPEVATVVVPPAPTGINTALYDARIAALKQYFSEVKNADIRMVYQQGEATNPANGSKNVKVTVGEVKSLLDD